MSVPDNDEGITPSIPTPDDSNLHSTYQSWRIDCDGCGLIEYRSEKADGAMIQCDQCDGWSHVLCMQEQYGLSESWNSPSFGEWLCPTCADKEVWTDER
jgi:hypothetical protein